MTWRTDGGENIRMPSTEVALRAVFARVALRGYVPPVEILTARREARSEAVKNMIRQTFNRVDAEMAAAFLPRGCACGQPIQPKNRDLHACEDCL